MLLAAAVATVVDRRPSGRRPFSVAAFAERVWGAQYAEVTAKLKGVLLAERTARAANDEFVRGKADPIATEQPARRPCHRRGVGRGGRSMKGVVPNVRKAKAIHEKKQAERNATANKMKKRAATTRCGR
jgi:hypothetical protein